MLHFISYFFTASEDRYAPFWSQVQALGETEYLYDGAFFTSADRTAEGIRIKLLPFLCEADRLVIIRMQPGSCAGQLPQRAKNFIQKYIS